MAQAERQEHPLAVYFWIWGLLFVLSTLSYMVDYVGFEGYLRWGLIITFMLLKAGFILAIFMHMMWERMALVFAIIAPPMLLLVLIGLMAVEGDYTVATRLNSFGAAATEFAEHDQLQTHRSGSIEERID